MTNLAPAIAPKSDQLNADDLIAGPLTITITRVVVSAGEQPISVHYEGDQGKPWKPCKSMARVLVLLWGADGKAFAGRSVRLYRDPEVRFGPEKVGGIRISHVSHIDGARTVSLTTTRGRRAPFTVKPLESKVQEEASGGASAPQAPAPDPEEEAALAAAVEPFAAEIAACATRSALEEWGLTRGAAIREAVSEALYRRVAEAYRQRKRALAPQLETA